MSSSHTEQTPLWTLSTAAFTASASPPWLHESPACSYRLISDHKAAHWHNFIQLGANHRMHTSAKQNATYRILYTVTYSELMRPCSNIHAWHSHARPVTHVSWSRRLFSPAANPGTVVPLQLSEAERTEQCVRTHNPQVLPDNTEHCVKGSEISLGLVV